MDPLNPQLYNVLGRNFGQVKVDNPGQKMLRRTGSDQYDPEILVKGETYRVCCPWCGDGKFKLYVNYTFGTDDPDTGCTYYINKCFRCGPKTDQLKELTAWLSIRRTTAILGDPDEVVEIPTFVSPGHAVHLDDPRAQVGWDYLAGRGIDPLEATKVYDVRLCIKGNPDLVGGGMEGRLIFPVTRDGEYVGWQARLAFEPSVFEKDRNFKNLRWYTAPGNWRSKHLLGYDQAKSSKFCVLVEGPTDLVAVGPPCVSGLGQTLSFGQIKLIAETWENVVLVGDHQDKADGTENRVQAATVNALLGAGVREVHLVKLPHGDPGSWERSEFFRFIAEDIKRSRVLSP